MDLRLQKKLAAKILGVGESRIVVNPSEAERIREAITREDVKRLIKDGVISVKPVHGISRGRWRIRHEKRKKGRRRGHGKRKGTATARLSRKEQWMMRIRAIRRYLRMLRDKGAISRREYRKLYMMAKGGAFTSTSHLKMYIKERIGK
ncbi:MAG: 50S ribosomal protein L19e [Thaumarchaeota archaeon]|nr:MAG: 50S ribosomal protein L19e [Nitrososphaerota archaeon]